MTNLKKFQQQIYQNKLDKGFNTTDIPKEFCFLQGEIAEAFDAYLKDLPQLGEELADVAIYTLGLAQILNIDLETEIAKKIEKNKHRSYQKVNGANIKTKTS